MLEEVLGLFAQCQTKSVLRDTSEFVVVRAEFVGLAFTAIVRKSTVFTILGGRNAGLAAAILEFNGTNDALGAVGTRDDFREFDVVRIAPGEIGPDTELGPVWAASSFTPVLEQYLKHCVVTTFAGAVQEVLAAERAIQ